MTGSVFVDTNVLVYRYDTSDPIKQARADAWYRHLWNPRCGRLSFQVLQEMYSSARAARFSPRTCSTARCSAPCA